MLSEDLVELTVDLGDRSYPIFIGSGLYVESTGEQLIQPFCRGKQLVIVSNETVAPLYLERVRKLFSGFDPLELVLPDGEQYKTFETVMTVIDRLLETKQSRNTTLVALGGGVVGDTVGFAAAVYQRGVDFIQIPTTLLAQVDSSVGGKTGINHPLGKNMVGAFHQPNCVVIDTDSLSTLPDREYSAGLAEVIKYGLVCDRPFFDWLVANIEAVMSRDSKALTNIIHRSCMNKSAVVASDEKESGRRAILNFGHTFGHAIESWAGYGSWLHGEAVSVGMVMAAELSCQLGNIQPEECAAIRSLLQRSALPVVPPKGISATDFLEWMSVDKKSINGQLRLVLLESIGQAVVTDRFDRGALSLILDRYCDL